MGISTARVQKVASRKGWLPLKAHPGSKLLGLVRFPAHKNSHMLSVSKTWALPSFLPFYNKLLQRCQQDQRPSVLQRQPLRHQP